MSQNLISLSRRDQAIALLDETVYAMIDHRRLSETIASHLGLQMQGETTEDDRLHNTVQLRKFMSSVGRGCKRRQKD
ncbi:hypothetical protein NIES37_49080 [Tolypothrix tenuis PCC 7101]|uniref:Uncharacterized protein n=1 Tax=Tolypothrix tenuis PCC 7101 TaxID=231146 RepID=A0A1Z4N589_9CYAN|nr:hypothetical protein [Aulosira sp. FACHB-113]BAZ00910.1 hypothetical protein NIES37_49080 [Tolypothrix tenuis PCC 7101]BAZ75167.1 hypothetical protein NIES50_37470 [Aulosira laxa NIES-50]